MNMNKIFLMSSAVFLLLAMVGSVFALRMPGVITGDWFLYGDIMVEWSSTDPTQTCPDYVLEMNETEWVTATVQSVVETNITFQLKQHFKNGTEKIHNYWINIDNGEGNTTLSFIAANLNVNNTLYTSGEYSTWTINETIPRTYPDGERLTNHINFTMEISDPEAGYPYYSCMNFYWDKLTGVLVEASIVSSTDTPGGTTYWSLSCRITESNCWVVPEFPALPLIIILFITLSFVMAGFKRRMTQTKTR